MLKFKACVSARVPSRAWGLRGVGGVPGGQVMPGPRGLPLVGTTLAIIAAGGPSKLHLYVDQRHRQLGPIYRERVGPVSAVFVSHPEYMRKVFASEGKHPRHIIPESWLLYNETYGCKRGLLFMEGEEWLHFRKVLNNVVLKPDNDELLGAIDVVAEDLVQEWFRHGRTGNLEQDLYRWSLEAIMSVLLGGDKYRHCRGELREHLTRLSHVVHNVFQESAKLSLLPAALAKRLHLPVWSRFVAAIESAVQIANELMDRVIPLAQAGDASGALMKKILVTGMKREDVYRVVTDLILAAGDTTAFTTQWLLHLVSLNKATQHKLREDIAGKPDHEVIQSGLLRGALRETLRMYPVAPFVTRYMPKDTQIGDYLVKNGELVIMSLYSSGRNELYFPKADIFMPERWLRNSTGYRAVANPYASLPFAMGPRSCIGRKIAETQILLTLGKILRRFQLETEEHNIDITLHLIAVPSQPISIKLTPIH